MRNLNAAKSTPIRFFLVLPYLCISVVAPTWLRIIKHEMACYISYVKHQLFKVNMSLSVFEEKQRRIY